MIKNRPQPRFPRSILLLAAFGLVLAVALVTWFQDANPTPQPLTFIGYTNNAGETLAIFQFKPKHDSSFFNVYNWQDQKVVLAAKPKDGVLTSNTVPMIEFRFAGNGPEFKVALPTNAVEFTVTYSHLERKGRQFGDMNNAGRVFSISTPFRKLHLFRSDRIVTHRGYEKSTTGLNSF